MKKQLNKENNFQEYYIDSSYVTFDNKDYLENYIYSDELNNKINNYFKLEKPKPIYIGLIGTWGSGKTSIVETVLKKYNTNNTKIFRYDAWKYEGDSFRRSFIQTILNNSDLKEENNVYKKTKESLYEDYSISSNCIIERLKLSNEKDKKISVTQIVVTILIITLLILFGIYNIYIGQTTAGNILTTLGAMGIFNIFYSTTVYSKSKLFSSEQFYKSLINILNESEGSQIIILIDNLDRCNIENFKETLNIIKGFYVEDSEPKLKNEKLVFIVPIDIAAFKSAYIEKDEKEIFFLDKIFDDLIYIKPKYNTDKLDYLNRLLIDYPKINDLISYESKSIIINSDINTPREIIKTINDYVTEYNILKNKTSIEFVENDENRNYIMKTVILKRRYSDFYHLAYINIEYFVKLELNPYDQNEFEKYKNSNELMNFLIKTRVFKPSDYYEFYQNQKIKSYNRIPKDIKDAIMTQKIDIILNNKYKNQIINYYSNIYDDVYNKFWNVNILNKYITLIELYKSNYFTDDEFDEIMLSWKIVYEDKEFLELNKKYVNIINFENEIIFGTKMYKNEKFNLFMLECLNNNTYKFDVEKELYEKLVIWLKNNTNLVLEEKYSQFLSSYCIYLLNNNISVDTEYVDFMYTPNIKLIRIDILNRMIQKISDNKIIIKIVKNLNKEKITDSSIVNTFIDWIRTKEINDLNVIILIFDYLNINNQSISSVSIDKLNITMPINENEIEIIIKKYSEANVYNNNLYKIIKKFKEKNIIKRMLLALTNNIPENNTDYINNFVNYFFELSDEDKIENIVKLVKVINKYKNNEKTIIKKLIENKILKYYYDCLETSEEREKILDQAMDLMSNNFELQLENIFLYESSIERMNTLISKNNNIEKYVLIINNVTKENIRKKIIINLIEIIIDKENIIDKEIEALNSLIIDENYWSQIKDILYKKEKINKELIKD